jgi:hypothetical protein
MALLIFPEKDVIHQLNPAIAIKFLCHIESFFRPVFRIGSQYDQTQVVHDALLSFIENLLKNTAPEKSASGFTPPTFQTCLLALAHFNSPDLHTSDYFPSLSAISFSQAALAASRASFAAVADFWICVHLSGFGHPTLSRKRNS